MDVKWDSNKWAMSEAAPSRRNQICHQSICSWHKHAKWKFYTVGSCPKKEHENKEEHIDQCPVTSAIQVWNKSILQLEIWWCTNQTAPNIAVAIVWGSRVGTRTRTCRQSVVRKLTSPNMGWLLFLEGCLSTMWWQEQEQFWTTIQTQKPGRWWTAELIKNHGLSHGMFWQIVMRNFIIQWRPGAKF